MSLIKNHNYTISYEAKQGLLSLFAAAVKPSRTTIWAHVPTGFIGADGQPVFEHSHRSNHVEGLSHALIQLARASDFDDWLPNPTIPMYLTTPGTKALFYNPPDLSYLQEASQDITPWSELPSFEQQDRLAELRRKRAWHPERVSRVPSTPQVNYIPKPAGYSNLNLSLPNDIRRYYHNLRLFHHIPLLPGCRHPHNLTTSISVVLEALGTGHLYPSAAYLQLISEPNPRKTYAAKHSASARHTRTYGNHAHTSFIIKDWRALPVLSQFTQADVDYCYREDNYPSLADLAQEACALNPILQLPSSPVTVTPAAGPPPPQAPVSGGRAKPHIDLVPTPPATTPTPSYTYHYKGRDVTATVIEAYTAHYNPPYPTFPQLRSLAVKADLPLYMLQRLATREYVRRLDNAQAQISTPDARTETPDTDSLCPG